MIGKVPAVSVPTELFKPAGTGLLNSSCILQLNTTVLPHFNSANGKLSNKSVSLFFLSVFLKTRLNHHTHDDLRQLFSVFFSFFRFHFSI